MKFCVQELEGSDISQGIVATKNVNVTAIRPHIYRHNFPTGDLQLEIYDSTNTLIATSEAVAISSIGSLAYYHGYILFNITASLKKGQTYTLKLVGTSGYAFAESAYCGWVNALDLGKYEIVGGAPASSYQYPYDYEIWERTSL